MSHCPRSAETADAAATRRAAGLAPALPDPRRAGAQLERERFDLAVVGGGITGAGLAREAAQRGLRVALVEAGDFAGGTSGRSSKLIHGGLRYLAMGDVALVRATARERRVLHGLAPHLAEPRRMVLPSRSAAGLARLRVAVTTYEKLGGVSGPDLHENWRGEELGEREPLLRGSDFRHACAYREYVTDDARLVLANLRAAVAAGAVVRAAAPVVGLLRDGGRVAGIRIRPAEGGEIAVRARAVVNAAGPFVERVLRLEDPEAPPRLHLSKGIHLVFEAARLPVREILAVPAADRRTVFAVRREAVTYVGTTDRSYTGRRPEWPEIEAEEVAYLLGTLNRHLRIDPPLTERDVIAAFAGLRPLVAGPGRAPQELSRRDEVSLGPAGLVTVAGGKLTGYRLMARAVLERTAESTGLRPAPPLRDEPPLPGGDFAGELGELAARLAGEAQVAPEAARRLARLYGAEAGEVLALGGEPVVPGGSVRRGEVRFAVRVEAARGLEDVVYRRIRSAWFDPADREAALEGIADLLGGELGWDRARRDRELEDVRARLAGELDFEGPAGPDGEGA